jgi:hypothetical protein
MNVQYWIKQGVGRQPAKPTRRILHHNRAAASMPPVEKQKLHGTST